MEGIELSQETVLMVITNHCRFDLDPDICRYSIGDIVEVRLTRNIRPMSDRIKGRLKHVGDDYFTLDISEKFQSKVLDIRFEDVLWMQKGE